MSDGLVQRLRGATPRSTRPRSDQDLMDAAADRIEALETALREVYGDVQAAKRVLEGALDA